MSKPWKSLAPKPISRKNSKGWRKNGGSNHELWVLKNRFLLHNNNDWGSRVPPKNRHVWQSKPFQHTRVSFRSVSMRRELSNRMQKKCALPRGSFRGTTFKRIIIKARSWLFTPIHHSVIRSYLEQKINIKLDWNESHEPCMMETSSTFYAHNRKSHIGFPSKNSFECQSCDATPLLSLTHNIGVISYRKWHTNYGPNKRSLEENRLECKVMSFFVSDFEIPGRSDRERGRCLRGAEGLFIHKIKSHNLCTQLDGWRGGRRRHHLLLQQEQQ